MKRQTFPLLLISLILVRATPALAQLTSAELYVDIDAYALADDEELPFQQQLFSDGPRFEDIFNDSVNIPWDIDLVVGNAESETTGLIGWLATGTSQILTNAQFHVSAYGLSPAASIAEFDAVTKVDFTVAEVRTLRIRGHVSATVALDEPELVSCQYNGIILTGDDRATPLDAGVYYFDVERTLYPEETGSLQCAAKATGGTLYSNTLEWEALVENLPEPEAGAGAIAIGAIAALRRRRVG